jgi:hypothetical protein
VASGCSRFGKLTSIRSALRSGVSLSASHIRSVGPVSPLYATAPPLPSMMNEADAIVCDTITARTAYPATSVGRSGMSSR